MLNTVDHLWIGIWIVADETNSETASPATGDLVESPVMEDPLGTLVDEGVVDGSVSGNNGAEADDDSPTVDEGQVFSYDRLKAKSSNPVKGIDYKRREVCA